MQFNENAFLSKYNPKKYIRTINICMKLKDLKEFRAVPAIGPDANRPTPVTFRSMAPPLPDEMYNQYEDDEESSKDKGHDHFITNIENDTIKNQYFRKVIYTATNCQLVLMSVPVNEDLGEEIHETIDQFIRIEEGEGKVVFNDVEYNFTTGSAFIIPQGTKHNIINTGQDDLKLYTVYSPPNHLKNTIHKTKSDAKRDKEHFDGNADTQ